MRSKKGRIVYLLNQSPNPHIRVDKSEKERSKSTYGRREREVRPKVSVNRYELKTPEIKLKRKSPTQHTDSFEELSRFFSHLSVRNHTPFQNSKSRIDCHRNNSSWRRSREGPFMKSHRQIFNEELTVEEKQEMKKKVSLALKGQYEEIQEKVSSQLKTMEEKGIFPKQANTLRAESILGTEIKKLEAKFLPKLLKQAKSEISLGRAGSVDRIPSQLFSEKKSKRISFLKKLEENLVHKNEKIDDLNSEEEDGIKRYQDYSEKIISGVCESLLNYKVNPI
ncbi:unnamed protein product [Blepharisma stoltei]|uniref:Uncharacterized protein n=1 Tax=Blepharisma stoltei TaxID=1481888 RepID=A0AAU9INX7_9CILI|nr:unnamed protein product [Blepharisma stoltei]